MDELKASRTPAAAPVDLERYDAVLFDSREIALPEAGHGADIVVADLEEMLR